MLEARLVLVVALLLPGSLSWGDDGSTTQIPESQPAPATSVMLPEQAQATWEAWTGDFDGMVERRVVRVAVPYGGYQFFYQGGQARGAVHDLLQKFETFINAELGRGNVKVYVLIIPLSRDQMLPALLAGNADLIAGDLTITNIRSEFVDFSRPILTEINEVVVTGPSAPPLKSLDDLSGQDVLLSRSSSYFEHMVQIAADMGRRGIEPPVLLAADPLLEAEDILELVDAGMAGITILDDYKARFWSEVFPNITVRQDLVVKDAGKIAWAMRKNSPRFAEIVEKFLRRYGRGTLVGNDTYKRYLSDASRVRCANRRGSNKNLAALRAIFEKYGEQYDFDWLMLAAQGFQESGLKQSRKSPAGAVGIMQIKPSTAADRNVGIDDVSTAENNIHAGTRYLRFIADRYFSGPDIDPVDQWLLALAAYNAGPAKVNRLRREAKDAGYDPNRWFDNVEIIAARRIGRETVTYVSNIFKFYVGYRLTVERGLHFDERFEQQLTGCAP